MRHLVLALALSLTACSGLPRGSQTFREHMRNPLVAQQYYAELVDHFVNLQIRNDPVIRDAGMKRILNAARTEALERAQTASQTVDESILGTFHSVQEETRGTALFGGNILHFSTDFLTVPGGDLHVYLTDVVDPRDVPFPDATAVDLGSLHLPYGAQSYEVPRREKAQETNPHTGTGSVVESQQETDRRHATVVIFDRMLKRLHGFAQLRP